MSKRFSRVYVEITNICNRNCSFCPGTIRPPKALSLEELGFILNKLEGYTDYIYLHVMGEPLAHPLLPRFVKLGTSLGFKIAITTNGSLLPARGDELLKSGLYKANISLHSFEEGEDSLLLNYINGCIDFADQASKAGILTILRLWNRGYDEGRNIDILEIIRSAFENCEWKWGARGARIRDKLHLEYGDRFEWPDMSAEDNGDRVFCYGLGDHFGILSDGTVIPCCLDRDGQINLGNIFERDLESILASDRAKAICEGFAERRASEELCRRCGYARRFEK